MSKLDEAKRLLERKGGLHADDSGFCLVCRASLESPTEESHHDGCVGAALLELVAGLESERDRTGVMLHNAIRFRRLVEAERDEARAEIAELKRGLGVANENAKGMSVKLGRKDAEIAALKEMLEDIYTLTRLPTKGRLDIKWYIEGKYFAAPTEADHE